MTVVLFSGSDTPIVAGACVQNESARPANIGQSARATGAIR
jgi:hypothetical protein